MCRVTSRPLRRLAVLATAVSALLLAASPASAIIDGEPDTTRPYVGVLVADYPGFGVVPLCSGTLVSPTDFVTAAHCVSGLPAGVTLLGVSFAQAPAYGAGMALTAIAATHAHPSFTPTDFFSDVAVVDLATPVTTVGYGALPALGLLEPLQKAKDVDFTIVGYGWQVFLPHSSGLGNRLSATSRLLGIEYAGKKQPGDLTVPSALKLTNSPAQGGGICYSDSGGPHFAGPATNVVAAISVAGTMNCTGVHYALRLDTQPALSFLAAWVSS